MEPRFDVLDSAAQLAADRVVVGIVIVVILLEGTG